MSIATKAVWVAAPSTERGQGASVNASAKGTKYAYGSGNLVIIRSVDKPEDVVTYTQHTVPVTAVRLSPNECYCASGDKNGNVRVWATNNADLTLKLETKPLGGSVRDIAWSGDGERIIVVGEGADKFGAAFLLNTGSSAGDIGGASRLLLTCDCKPQRPFRVAAAGEESQVNFYEGPPFKFKSSNKDHTQFVNCVRFSPTGEMFASVSSDKKIYLFEGKTGERAGELPCDHTGSVYSCSWSPDGQRLLTSAADKTVKLWNVPEGKCEATFKAPENTVQYMQVAAIMAGNQMMSVSLNGDINYWQQTDPSAPARVVRGHQRPIVRMAGTQDGRIVTAGTDGVVLAWNEDGSATRLGGKAHGSQLTGLAVDGERVATTAFDDTVLFGSLASGKFESDVKVKGPMACQFVPGSGTLVVAGAQSLYVIADGKVESETKVDYTPVSLAVAAGVVVVGAKNAKAYVYSLAGTGLTQTQELTEQRSAVNAATVSADGALLATGDAQKQVVVYTKDGDQWKAMDFPASAHSSTIKALQFVGGNKALISIGLDGNLIQWDLADVLKKKVFQRSHVGGGTCVALVNGVLYSGGHDACVRSYALEL